MAEWLSTDFFQARIAASRRSGNHAHASFSPIQSLLADCANHVKKPAEHQQYRESKTKQQFCGQ
jgi:hypothetical protein